MIRTTCSVLCQAARGVVAGLQPSSRTPITAGLLWEAQRGLNGIGRVAEPEKGDTKFSGYYAGGFYINNVQVPGSVMASSDLYLMWRPRTMAEVTPASLVFLEVIKPTPEVLVLGCGLTSQPLPKDVADYLATNNIKVEVLDSRNATAYFNVLNEEGRVAVGALLAMDPSAALPEVMPSIKEPLWERGFALGGSSRM